MFIHVTGDSAAPIVKPSPLSKGWIIYVVGNTLQYMKLMSLAW